MSGLSELLGRHLAQAPGSELADVLTESAVQHLSKILREYDRIGGYGTPLPMFVGDSFAKAAAQQITHQVLTNVRRGLSDGTLWLHADVEDARRFVLTNYEGYPMPRIDPDDLSQLTVDYTYTGESVTMFLYYRGMPISVELDAQ